MTTVLAIGLEGLALCTGMLWWSSASAAPTAAPAPPAGLAGTWEVEKVAVDLQDQMHWAFRPDDPQLLGRELVVEPERVRLGAGSLDCKPGWKAQPSTWGALIGKGFPRPSGGGRSKTPTPVDFGLSLPAKGAVTAYSTCSGGAAFPQDRWVALTDADTLALHYDNQVLLILKRRPATAAPRASFACARAGTATEKAICASHTLAGWDRSVAAAYEQALERRPDDATRIQPEQQEWLRKRNACGADTKCLQDQMVERVSMLVQE